MICVSNNCPVCGQKAVAQCRCFRSDSRCALGHEWHYCTVHDKVVLGPSDHGKEGCTCKPEAHERQADYNPSFHMGYL